MTTIYQFLLARLLPWLAKVSWADFARIVAQVGVAASNWPKPAGITSELEAEQNQKRAGFVVTFIRRVFPGISTGTINFLLELAVSWFKRTA